MIIPETCIEEDTESPDDRTGDEVNIDLDDVEDALDNLDLESCEDAGGTRIEASQRGGESYCDMGEDEGDRGNDQEITQEDCERRGGNWTAAPDREDEYYCDVGARCHYYKCACLTTEEQAPQCWWHPPLIPEEEEEQTHSKRSPHIDTPGKDGAGARGQGRRV